MQGSDEPMFDFIIGYIFFVAKSFFARIAAVDGLQYDSHAVFVLYLIRMCVAKGKGFDQILNLWQQRGSFELEALDFGGVHGSMVCCD